MKINDNIEITNENNLDLMKRYSDKYFDLAIVDPPYGIGISKNPVRQQPENFSLAMCEYAWFSIQKPAKIWSLSVMKEQNKIHPTQKPIELYEWLIMRNAEKGYKILDTHLGSGSIAIAIDIINKREKLNLQFIGCELDTDYYNKAIERIKSKTITQYLF